MCPQEGHGASRILLGKQLEVPESAGRTAGGPRECMEDSWRSQRVQGGQLEVPESAGRTAGGPRVWRDDCWRSPECAGRTAGGPRVWRDDCWRSPECAGRQLEVLECEGMIAGGPQRVHGGRLKGPEWAGRTAGRPERGRTGRLPMECGASTAGRPKSAQKEQLAVRDKKKRTSKLVLSENVDCRGDMDVPPCA